MARFLKHEPCPKCGSTDNLGRYDDGSAFCFGCHYREGRSGSPANWKPEQSEAEERSYPKIPDDAGTYFSAEAVEWLAKYHVTVVEAIQRNFKWSPSKQQLIFDMDDIWQARNFRTTYVSSDGSTKKASKYFTSGNVLDVLPIYNSQHQEAWEEHVSRSDVVCSANHRTGSSSGSVVLVEDCVSAVRIARQCDAMPVLGSHVANAKINRLAGLYSGPIIVWLDGDKYKEACDVTRRFNLLGRSARAIYTELDPKEYSDTEISKIMLDNI